MRDPLLIPVLAVLLLGGAHPGAAAPRKLPDDAFKPTVSPPGSATLKGLGRGAGFKDAVAHGKAKSLGGARFLAVVSSRRKQAVQVLVVEGKGASWRVLHRIPLALPFSASRLSQKEGACEGGKLAAIAHTSDYDADGKREAKVRTLFCRVVPAVGDVMVRRLAIINLDGTPRLALHIELAYDALPTAMGAIKARERFKDLNGDGHPDMFINQRKAVPVDTAEGFQWKRSVRRFIYVPRTDTYREKKPRRKKRKR